MVEHRPAKVTIVLGISPELRDIRSKTIFCLDILAKIDEFYFSFSFGTNMNLVIEFNLVLILVLVHIPYTVKHLRAKTFAVRPKMNIHRKLSW